MNIKDIEQNRDSLIESLIAEEQELVKKIEKARKNDDYGLYKNLIRALTDVTSLKQRELANIPREHWSKRFSKFRSNNKDMISIWEQKGQEVRNIEKYIVVEDLSNKPIYNLYYDLECRDDNLFKCTIYFKDIITGMVGNFESLSKHISNLCLDQNVNIYGDIRGLGIGLADYLKELGYIVQPTTMIINDVTRNILGKETKQNYSKTRNI
jgi:hypothetical protein